MLLGILLLTLLLPSKAVLQIKREDMLASGKIETIDKSVVAFMGSWEGENPSCPKCGDVYKDWLESSDIIATVEVDTFWVNCSVEVEWCESQKLDSSQLPIFRAYLKHLPIDTYHENFTTVRFLHWVDLQFDTSAASHLSLAHRANFHYGNFKTHFTESTGSNSHTAFVVLAILLVLPPAAIVLFVLFSLLQSLFGVLTQPFRKNQKQKAS
eukprot:TRINITY_DN3706_c0_g2_i1.p1 TRINITY_DN3706_c0_g2~~TRINITY_DN3706_c0_g2_i1.p1  ORF type:complete len:211 (+),score=27.19 TRINITY_DN3706_c0_g2_i1:59-691(+)